MARKNACTDDLRGTELDMRRYDGAGGWYYDDEDDYDHDEAMRAAIGEKVAGGGILGGDEIRWLLGRAGIPGTEHYDIKKALETRYNLVPKHGE